MALSSSYVQSLPTCSSDVTQLPALSTVLVDQHRVSRWLLMRMVTTSLSMVSAACFASPIAWSVFCHISSGSCYTQPDFGYCAGGYQHGCNHVRFHHGQQRALWYLWHPGQRPEHKSPCHPLLRRFPGPYALCSSLSGRRIHLMVSGAPATIRPAALPCYEAKVASYPSTGNGCLFPLPDGVAMLDPPLSGCQWRKQTGSRCFCCLGAVGRDPFSPRQRRAHPGPSFYQSFTLWQHGDNNGGAILVLHCGVGLRG